MVASCQFVDEKTINEAFLAGAPLIARTMLAYNIQTPNWFRDMFKVEPWPAGNGTLMQQPVFRGSLPKIEENFDQWSLQDNTTGCDPQANNNCAYNFTTLGGHAMEMKITRLMDRDFKSPEYCVRTIQNTFMYEAVFQQILNNLNRQIDFVKENNIGRNFLVGIAKKLLIDGGGFKPNVGNPYAYRNKGTATLSALSIGALEVLYEMMRRMPETVPYDVVDSAPVYALVASPQLLSHLWRDNPGIRQDLRFSSMADKLVTSYNFMSSIMGMYVPVPYLYPRRFRYDNANSKWIQIYPWVNGVPAQVGSFTDINMQYEDPSYATHEEVLIHGRDPFTVWYQPTVSSLGAGSSFGPEPGYFDSWQWSNPETKQDPGRRVGFYWTHASIGISAQNSEGVFGILVPRVPTSMMVQYWPSGSCPPTDPTCTNLVPATGCPCPGITSVVPNNVSGNSYFVSLVVPLTANNGDIIQFGYSTGGYVNGTQVGFSADRKTLEVTFGVVPPNFQNFTTIFCDNTLKCSSGISSYNTNCVDNTRIDLVLQQPIKAVTNNDVVTVFFGNGTSMTANVIGAPDMTRLLWTVDIGSAAFCDDQGGVARICVPTGTNAACPACTLTPTAVQCS